MKVLIVDDNTSGRLMLKRFLKKSEHQIAMASDGIEALDLFAKEKFDLVITDWMMPNMNGIELIKRIRTKYKEVPLIIMFSALGSNDAEEKAFSAGANLFLKKPFNQEVLLNAIKNVIEKKGIKRNRSTQVIKPQIKHPKFWGIFIASSTGGPPALTELFLHMPETNNASFFIVQHGPAWMLESLVDRIQGTAKMEVLLGKDGMEITNGKIYLSPGNVHMVINPEKGCIELLESEPINFVKPAADPLFQTGADYFQKKTVGVVLTGMGKDGTVGAGFISASGGYIIAQDPDTAVISSMPQSIIKLRIVDQISLISNIPTHIKRHIPNY